jgi:hypothetical protein
MDPNEPSEPKPGRPEPGGAAYEALRRLEERLDRASDAAERLLAEAAARAAAATGRDAEEVGSDDTAGARPQPSDGPDDRTPPPSGWQIPGGDRSGASDLELFTNLVQSLRDLIPPELQRRLAEAFRELLMALRALIDWYLERVDQRRREPAEVQDIPIS